MEAAAHGHTEIVQLLVKAGVDITKCNLVGYSLASQTLLPKEGERVCRVSELFYWNAH